MARGPQKGCGQPREKVEGAQEVGGEAQASPASERQQTLTLSVSACPPALPISLSSSLYVLPLHPLLGNFSPEALHSPCPLYGAGPNTPQDTYRRVDSQATAKGLVVGGG